MYRSKTGAKLTGKDSQNTSDALMKLQQQRSVTILRCSISSRMSVQLMSVFRIFSVICMIASCLELSVNGECWTRFNDTNLFGAENQTSIASEDACRSSCINNSSCIGVDWNTVDNSCWFATNSTNPAKHRQIGITHWDLNRTCSSDQSSSSSATSTFPLQSSTTIFTAAASIASSPSVGPAECWTRFNDTNLFGGENQTSIASEDACRSSCINNSSCIGVDWNTVDNSCWFATNSTNPAKHRQIGITHWDVNRICLTGSINSTTMAPSSSVSFSSSSSVSTSLPVNFTGSSTAATMSTGPAQCWTRFNDTNLFGAENQTSIASEDACRSSCINNSSCIGVDWNTVDNSCWFATNSTNPAKHRQIGITHWDLNRICLLSSINSTTMAPSSSVSFSSSSSVTTSLPVNFTGSSTAATMSTGPAECWTRFNDTNLFGGENQTSIASEDACRSSCINNSSCLGVDWNTVDNSCWFATNSTNPAKHRQIGITHWDVNRTCLTGSINSTTMAPSSSVSFSSSSSVSTSLPVNFTGSSTAATMSTGPAECWTSFNDTNLFGGENQTSIASEDACRSSCINNSSCIGVDWNTVDNSCWFATTSTDPAKHRQIGITHWDLNRICLLNSSITSAQSTTAFSLSASTTTFPVVGSTTTLPLLTSTTFSASSSSASTTATTLPVASNSTATSAGSTTAMTPSGSNKTGCTYSWVLTPDHHISKGVLQSLPAAAATEDGCLAACAKSDGCVGVDWNLNSNECWFMTNTTDPTKYSQSRINHWDLTRICIDSNSLKCPNVWSLTNYAYSPNGRLFIPATREDTCKAACVNQSTCTGIDWTSDTSTCYLSTTDGPVAPNGATAHWDLTRQFVTFCPGVCISQWTVVRNKSSPGAVAVVGDGGAPVDEASCRALCLRMRSNCSGVDFTKSGSCLVVTAAAAAAVETPGVDHWTYATAATQPSCGDNCTNVWIVIVGYSDRNAVYIQWLTSMDECRTACTNAPSCSGFEFTNARCLFSSSGNLSWTEAFGIIHNELVRSNCGSGCSGSWLLSTNTRMSSRVFYATTTEVVCQNACLFNGTTCTAVDYVPSTGQCYLGLSSNTTTEIGTNHFERIMDVNCVSARNPTTVFPVQSSSTSAVGSSMTTVCVVQWENYTDANSLGCDVYPQYTDVDGCTLACLRTVQFCVVANFNVPGNPDPNRCYLCLNSNGTLPQVYGTQYVNTFRIKSRC